MKIVFGVYLEQRGVGEGLNYNGEMLTTGAANAFLAQCWNTLLYHATPFGTCLDDMIITVSVKKIPSEMEVAPRYNC